MKSIINRALVALGLRPRADEKPAPMGTDAHDETARQALAELAARLDAGIEHTQQAFAEAVNAARSTQARRQEALDGVDEWSDKARQAEARRRTVLAAPDHDREQLQRLDELIEDAVRRSVDAETLAEELRPVVNDRVAATKALKADLAALRRRREELEDRRGELVAREDLARARSEVADVLADLAVDAPDSRMGRIEAQVRSDSRAAEGRAAVAALSSPDTAFDAELSELMRSEETRGRIADLRKEQP